MPITIKDPEAEWLARTLARRDGDTLAGVILDALRERLRERFAREERQWREAQASPQPASPPSATPKRSGGGSS